MSSRHRLKSSLALTVVVVALALLTPTPGGRTRLPAPTAAHAEASPSGPQDAVEPPALTRGRPAEGRLGAGEAHAYRVALDAGQYLRAAVEADGAATEVAVYDPEGRRLVQTICRRRGEATPVSLVADGPGAYRLEVRSPEEGGAGGRYRLQVVEARPAAGADEQRIAAERLLAEGEQLVAQWSVEAGRAAADRYEEASRLLGAAAEPREEAYAQRRLGDVQQSFGRPQDALGHYERALALYRRLKDLRGEARTLNEAGAARVSLGENQRALGDCTRALALSRAAGDRWAEAQALNNLGEVYNWSGNLQQALDYYRRALPLWESLGDRQGQAQTLTYLGYTSSDLGQMQEALDFYNLALPLWQSARDRRGEASTLTATGRLYSRVGEGQAAFDFFERAMALVRLIGDPVEEARILTGMAYLYNGLGEKQQALEHYGRALALFRSANYPGGEAETLADAGGVYLSLGDYQKAFEHYGRARSIFREVGDRRLENFVLKETGKVYDAWGEKEKALECFVQARSFYHSEQVLRGEADALNLIGRVYEGWGRSREALDHYGRALALNRQAKYLSGEAATLYNLSRAERERGNLPEARARAEAALQLVESLRTKVSSQDLRTSYFATTRQYYELYIDVLMRLRAARPADGLDALAFEVSERARARSLLETLAGSRGQIRQGVDPALLERERALARTLSAKVERQSRVLGGPHAGEDTAALAAEVEALTGEYEAVEAEIRSRSPHYAALTQPRPLGLAEVQRLVLDDDRTVLLEYALGDERSYVWAVTRDGVAAYELPGRARIEESARRLYALLTARQPVEGETAEARLIRLAQADADYWREADALSDMVLGPVAAHFHGRRLLVVADGALQYVPFGALTAPAAGGGADETDADARPDGGTRPPLFVRHEVVSLPSASVLPVLRGEAEGRAPAEKSVAVFADPVFERDDPRVGAQASGAGGPERAALPRLLRDADALFEGGEVPRLPASREEAERIAALLPEGEVSKVMDFGASRAAATAPDLARYRVVHFATHGVLNSRRPELSGIVLSLVDERGEPQDGFLRLHDIYNLRLPADLVVLSACNTGLGKEVRGEGLVGLTRGFMYAGAGAVVASLWKVDDEATAELMGHLYEGMFRRGLAPAAALREAQLRMWRQRRWRAPYFWAGFIIQGQYGPLRGGPAEVARAGAATRLAAWGAAAATLSFVALYVVRRRRRRAAAADAKSGRARP